MVRYGRGCEHGLEEIKRVPLETPEEWAAGECTGLSKMCVRLCKQRIFAGALCPV